MGDAPVCAVCGNEVDPKLVRCPHCRGALDAVGEKPGAGQHRVVNLERGMPSVRDALKKFEMELQSARLTGCRALVLIHGYGSSGEGGAIREAVRAHLEIMSGRKSVKEILYGEECGKRSGPARQLMKRFPFLNEYARRRNPGITLVVI